MSKLKRSFFNILPLLKCYLPLDIPLSLLLTEKIDHRSTKKRQLLLLNSEIVQVRNIPIHQKNEYAQNYLDLAVCDIKFI